MMNDLIADALTRIRNAAMRKLEVTTLIHSNAVEAVCNVLKQKEYIEDCKVVEIEGSPKKSITVTLKYDDNDNSVINELKKLSKSGRRVYKNSSELKSFKNGYGTIIVSTNKGIIANDEAYKLNVGGEILCSVW
ncbi:MAG: 30S ribosomal protein S8 [Campylobacterota bacterium]|nr:30S ribosomal protein S8 [Campylobacterota bacterium]